MARTSPAAASAPLTALCAAQPFEGWADVAPEWVHLLPAGEVRTADGRGPYTVKSMHSLVAALKAGDKLPLDECHSTDLAAPRGRAAPARGWIVALEAREDGLWGKVEWTAPGLQLMADRAYRGVSPVIAHSKTGQVLGVLRASLTNTPNLLGLTALHSKDTAMDFKTQAAALVGLDAAADDDAIFTALQAAIDNPVIAPATDVQVLGHPAFVALQTQSAEQAQQLTALQSQIAQDKAQVFVDGAIAAGRVGVIPLRDRYIAMHAADPAGTEELVGALPILTGETRAAQAAPGGDGATVSLQSADRAVIAMMGLSEEDYLANLKAEAKKKETV